MCCSVERYVVSQFLQFPNLFICIFNQAKSKLLHVCQPSIQRIIIRQYLNKRTRECFSINEEFYSSTLEILPWHILFLAQLPLEQLLWRKRMLVRFGKVVTR